MKMRQVEVKSGLDNTMVTAQLMVCGNCGYEAFAVLFIHNHVHLQCARCDMSYCQGNCSSPEKINKTN
jgi:hypothetical protein